MSHLSYLEYWPSYPSGLRWVASPYKSSVIIHSMAGTINSLKRWKVTVKGVRKYCHRVVWELVNGPIPPGMEVDHIDGDPSNNNISKLRLADRNQQLWNTRKRKDNISGVKGVFYNSRCKKWHAKLEANGKLVWQRMYNLNELEQAAADIKVQRDVYHNQFARSV